MIDGEDTHSMRVNLSYESTLFLRRVYVTCELPFLFVACMDEGVVLWLGYLL